LIQVREPWCKERRIMKTEKRKGDRPETTAQAVYWETIKNRYLAAGLCYSCAVQVAYGHQMSFLRIKPPCDSCRGVAVPELIVSRHGGRGQQWLNGHWHPVGKS
jgi:hypothetical protein